ARRKSKRWNDNVKLELQHLVAATPAGTSLVACQRQVTVRPATWDAVWGEYLHPKMLGALCALCALPPSCHEAAIMSQRWWSTRKQLVVLFGDAGTGTLGGWGTKAVLQACRKMVERPTSSKPPDRLPGKVATVDEFRTSQVSSAMHSPQPSWSQRFKALVRVLTWCPRLDQTTPGDLGKWVDRDCDAALNLQRARGAQQRPVELCWWIDRAAAPALGKEYPAVSFKKLQDRPPKAQTQQPVAYWCVH
ncbi:hypothetical protein QJQ45_030406, partial [Haematococcus lacustris]